MDAAGLGVLRILFGAIMAFAAIRFWAKGWIERLYLEPDFHFTYLGFGWLPELVAPWIYFHFALMALAALCVCVGVWARPAALVFAVLFTWAELAEKALYLNHYYLVSLLAVLLVVTPCDRAFALRPSRRAQRAGPTVGAWVYTLLRGQVALVYFFAGLAKVHPDWLIRGEPLATWLAARAHLPWIGPLFADPTTALVMSWAGAAFDLTIWAWLSWRPARPYAYAAAVFFHVTVWLLFPIGVFSWVMLASVTVFFAASWPRRFVAGASPRRATPGASLTTRRVRVALVAAWLSVQTLIPLRHTLYDGPVNWTEEGFRFAWRVMLIEKTATLEYRVAYADGTTIRVYPSQELAAYQWRVMRTQPDMILEYAHHLRDTLGDPNAPVAVYADAWVSLNGRAAARMVDPTVDLGRVERTLRGADWILRTPGSLPD